MTRKTKVVLGVLFLGGSAAGAYYGYDYYNNKDIPVVQAGEAVRQDLIQSVASTGEIKPKKSVNISSNAMGRIVRMPVKEGDRVKSGDLLISLESIQTAADVEAAQAMLHSKRWSWLKAWAMKIARHRGMKKAIVALNADESPAATTIRHAITPPNAVVPGTAARRLGTERRQPEHPFTPVRRITCGPMPVWDLSQTDQ